MKPLKLAKNSFYELEYCKLQDLLIHYGLSTRLEVYNNTSLVSHGVSTEFIERDEWLKDHQERNQEVFGNWFVEEVLGLACHDGLIPAGNYIIDICW